jgi:prevent-host-death family protein
MQTVNIHDAKTQLSRLIAQAVAGEPFIIAKAGKPLVKVTRIEDESPVRKRRLGFMKGEVQIPDDFDRMGQAEIDEMFYGSK